MLDSDRHIRYRGRIDDQQLLLDRLAQSQTEVALGQSSEAKLLRIESTTAPDDQVAAPPAGLVLVSMFPSA